MGLRIWGLLSGQGVLRHMQRKHRGGGRAGAEVWEDGGAPPRWRPHGVPVPVGSEGRQRLAGRGVGWPTEPGIQPAVRVWVTGEGAGSTEAEVGVTA